MLERDLEQLFRRSVTGAGGVIYKLDARSRRGAPDRVVALGGRTMFVELKVLGGRVSLAQEVEHQRIRQAGGEVWVLRGPDEVRRFCGLGLGD